MRVFLFLAIAIELLYSTPALAQCVIGKMTAFPGHNVSIEPGRCLQSPNGRYIAMVQDTDWNFVIYDNSMQPAEDIFSTDVAGRKVYIQEDGNLVAYDAAGEDVWSSDTWIRIDS